VIVVAGKLRVPRSRGAISGLLLVLLGIWGALIPLVGPLFDYAYTPDRAWAFTAGQVWLSIVPGVVTAVAGLVVLLSANRAVAVFCAWLAALAGAWFVVGGTVSTLWTSDGESMAGEPIGGTAAQVAEELGFFLGVGTAIVFVAALALGRFTVLGAKEVAMAEHAEEARAEEARAYQSARAHEAADDADRTRDLPAATKDNPPPPTTAPGTTTPGPTTYAGSKVGDDDRPVSERAARRLDDHPDERLRPDTDTENRPRQTT
jgi:hypothetical protein